MHANIEIGTVRPKVAAMPPRLQALVLAWLATGEDAPAPVKRGERRAKSADATPKAAVRRKVDPLLETRTAAELHLAGESPAKLAAQEAKAIAKGTAWRPIVVRFADGAEITAGSFMADDDAAKADAVRFARSAAMAPDTSLYVEQCRQSLATHEAAGGNRYTWEAPPAPERPMSWVWSEADGRNVRVHVRALADVAAVEIMPQACPSYRHERPQATFSYDGASPLGGYKATVAVDILGSKQERYMRRSAQATTWKMLRQRQDQPEGQHLLSGADGGERSAGHAATRQEPASARL